jgi:hypothetical protein
VLKAQLGILRRPQTAEEASPPPARAGLPGAPDLAEIRGRATRRVQLPDGSLATIYVVTLTDPSPPVAQQRSCLADVRAEANKLLRGRSARVRRDTMKLLRTRARDITAPHAPAEALFLTVRLAGSDSVGGTGGGFDPAVFSDRGIILGSFGGNRSHFHTLVPDGVASVRMTGPGIDATTAVTENIAAITLARRGEFPRDTTMTWLGPDGTELKRYEL